MKILVTGAHFTPAVAVIEELKKNKDVKVVYVGRKTTIEGDSTSSLESQVIPQLDVKFIPIISGRLQRSFTIYTIPSLLKIPIGFFQSLFIILQEKPDVVLSFGGYVAVPLVIAAWLMSIPVIIHEQTLVSGLANKISSLFAQKVALSFEANNQFSKDKVILTGLPLRREIINPTQKLSHEYEQIFKTAREKKLPVILVTGGNQGSHVINLAIEQALDKLIKICCIIHQTGDSSFKDFDRLSQKQNSYYLVKKSITSGVGAILSKIDLVVSRAGANILVELAFFGVPSLLIPIPYLYQDEQNKNARYFSEKGLCQILYQSNLNSESLYEKIKQMLKGLPSLKQKAKQAKGIMIPDAAQRLALETMLLVKVPSSLHLS